MRIAVPTADYPPIEGGISTVALQVSRELVKLGHEVTVIAPGFNNMDAFDSSEPVEVVRYPGYNLGWLRYLPMARTSKSILHSADRAVAINVAYGGLMAARAGIPFVVFAYGYEFLKFERNPLVRHLLLRVYRSAGRVIAISSYTRDALIRFGVSPKTIDVILPGAALGERKTTPCATTMRRTILAVGRFMPRKGQETLIRALPKVIEKVPNARLVLVGQGPRLGAARRLVAGSGLSDRVEFLSGLTESELAEQYRDCDVFALPTGEAPGGQVEGFGLVFTEAQAYGKPVIAGRSGGTVDAVLHTETGLLVDPNNESELVDAVVRVLTDRELAQRLGENGRRRIETELNWTRFTGRLVEILENLA